MGILRHLPNALTCCNLLCGCFGIVLLAQPETRFYAPWFVWWACVFDFLDGFVARMLKVSSPIGKELDSLADMVTFGLLPSMYMYYLLSSMNAGSLSYLAFLIAVASAVRLAKFNIDERQVDGFIGVPTPANALFITGLGFTVVSVATLGVYGLLAITLLFSWLLVSPFPLFSLKFKSFGWKGNEVRFTFLAIAVLLIAFLQEAAISVMIITYIAMSLLTGWRGAGKDN